jgi:putative membrane protein
MPILAKVFVVLVAASHFGFFVLETFMWQTPTGMKIFRRTPSQAKDSASLAANQGVYNAFLAGGLVWALAHPNPDSGVEIARFFLGCVVIAGIVGGATVNKRIFFVQGVPALIGLVPLFI